jgi:hypothetical protein
MSPLAKESFRDLLSIFTLIAIFAAVGYVLFWLPFHKG